MKNRHKKNRLIFVSTIFVISILALVFVIFSFSENIVFFYSPSDLRNPELFKSNFYKKARVGGLVLENSVKKLDPLHLEFVITDKKSELLIVYVGLTPDLFRENQGVIAQGKFDQEKNRFFADELLVKHDENYMPPEVANALKK